MRQPLLRSKANGKIIHLPPECCLLANVPDSIRKGPNMRNALMRTKVSPSERLSQVLNMTKMLEQMKITKDWGF